MWLFQIFSQKHPEPFFALAKELYPGQFKVWNTLYGPLCNRKINLDFFYSVILNMIILPLAACGLSITVLYQFSENLYLQRHCIA